LESTEEEKIKEDIYRNDSLALKELSSRPARAIEEIRFRIIED